ncbi:MAG TPA: type II secretion system protein GspM [Noviherbaspirillum sp.]
MKLAAGQAGQSALAFWNQRNPRERTMLAAAIAVVLLGLIYLLLLDPAISGRAQLEQQLPALRQQAAEVRSLTREATSGNARTATTVAAVTRESLQASLSRRGLTAQEISINGEIVRVQFADAAFSALVDWMADMHRSARLAVIEAKVEAGAEVDRVNANFTLRQERGEQAQ